jgi:hypothetical protein
MWIDGPHVRTNTTLDLSQKAEKGILVVNYYNGRSYRTHMFQMDSETLLKFAELFRLFAELFSSTCCNYFIHLQQTISATAN